MHATTLPQHHHSSNTSTIAQTIAINSLKSSDQLLSELKSLLDHQRSSGKMTSPVVEKGALHKLKDNSPMDLKSEVKVRLDWSRFKMFKPLVSKGSLNLSRQISVNCFKLPVLTPTSSASVMSSKNDSVLGKRTH